MPTFNQLVRKGRQTAVKKSTAPALQRTYNSLRKKALAEDTKAVRDEMNELLAQYRREKENAETR